jgi:hypothetical protein
LQFYFSHGSRKIIYLELGGIDRTESFQVGNLGQGGHNRPESSGMVEICGMAREAIVRDGLAYGSTLGPGKRRSARHAKGGGGGGDENTEKIKQMIMKYPTTPMAAIVHTVPWLSDPDFEYVREDDKLLALVIDTLKSRVCHWNFYDFKIMYTKHSCVPLWNCMDIDTSNFYYPVEDGLQIINELLAFQFGSPERIYEFLLTVWNVCERKIPKLNSIAVVSPPSAGKNFFFDMILAFYWNKGQLGNPNKNNTFAYQEAQNKRVLLWNEPNYESSETDMIKMILGGDNYTVKVKYKSDCNVGRTPVIILSNKRVNFMNDPAFDDRCTVFNWMSAPILKNYTLKPSPLTYIALMEFYNIC